MLVPITAQNAQVYANLCQPYEAEFAPLTGERPRVCGSFAVQTPCPTETTFGYLYLSEGLPVGFAVAARLRASDGAEGGNSPHAPPQFDVCEFFVLPANRREGLGRELARGLFLAHPGRWQVRQIEGAHRAVAFWRRIIGELCPDHDEQVVNDAHWGRVTRQRFSI